MWRFDAATVAKFPTVLVVVVVVLVVVDIVWVVIDWAAVDTLDVVVVWLLTDDLTTAAIVGPLLLTVELPLFEEFAFIGVGLIAF